MIDNKENKQLRILTSAEAFGYGPCSKLTAIVRNLRKDNNNLRIDFLGEKSALSFALQNNYLFNVIREYDGTYPDPDDVDLILSVMNPYTILWGWFNRKKCVYVDSLYWFWKFEGDKFDKLESTIDQLTNSESIDEVWALVKDITGHNLHYLAHRLATLSCSQYFNTEDKPRADKFRKNIKSVIEVDPIIDISYKDNIKRDTVLISLGGLLSPLNREKEALNYVSLVFKLTEDFISEASGKYKIVVATSPEIARLIKTVPGNTVITSLSQEEMLRAINRSVLVLTPAGITTMYECLMYDTPFFVLPELHDGHYPNYLRLSKNKTKGVKELSSIFPNALINPLINNTPDKNPDEEIRKVQSLIKRINLTSDKTFRRMKANVDKLIDYISNPEKLRELAKLQKENAIGKRTKKNKDVVEVVNRLLKEDKAPAVKKKYLIGFISSALNLEDQSQESSFKLFGKNLASNNINVATGAAIGIPHIIGTSAKASGSRLIGFSPSTNALIHSRQLDNAPINDFDTIYFRGDGFTARSLEFINSVDAIIMTSGRMGTLSEFTIAFEEGVPILILKGFGGISDHIEEILSYTNKVGLIPPTIVNSIEELSEKLMTLLNKNYYK